MRLLENKNNILTLTLSWYSSFFIGRTAAIDREIAKIKFKSEYTDFVQMIKEDIGPFTGAHVRIMPDHHGVYKFTEKGYKDGFDQVSRDGLPLLLSIDDWNHPYINKYNQNHVLVHELILGKYRKQFMQLSHHNRIDLATISMLLMVEAEDFIGTYPSTYTTYIQQQRAQRGIEEWRFFDYPPYTSYDKAAKPYSWHSIEGGTLVSWEREWEECRLSLD